MKLLNVFREGMNTQKEKEEDVQDAGTPAEFKENQELKSSMTNEEFKNKEI